MNTVRTGRTFSTSSIHRAAKTHGHNGSRQKSDLQLIRIWLMIHLTSLPAAATTASDTDSAASSAANDSLGSRPKS